MNSMWVLEIKQRVPRENYFLDERVVFRSRSINKLTNIIESFSLVQSDYHTEFVLTREVEANEN